MSERKCGDTRLVWVGGSRTQQDWVWVRRRDTKQDCRYVRKGTTGLGMDGWKGYNMTEYGGEEGGHNRTVGISWERGTQQD